MARLRLNEAAIKGLESLSRVPIETLRVISDALSSQLRVKLLIGPDISAVVTGLDLGDLVDDPEDLADAILGLHLLTASRSEPIEESAKEIAATVANSNDLILATAEKLQLLLDIAPIRSSAKAWSLIDDHDKVFLNSRVITDIRPIFDEDLSQPLKATLITHTLKLVCQKNDSTETLYVVLDNNDARDLIDSLQRALQKSNSLKNMLAEESTHRFGTAVIDGTEDAN